ncbi:MAG: hypothetical protein D3922_03225, partial [Candidatus Electrothrix sp. AR1]|nr:hypothetical protein [Candidatus Electrothrix sp. AR1]
MMNNNNKPLPYEFLRGNFILLLVLSIMLIAVPICSTASTNPLHVLMLYSWHKDMPWQLAFEKGFRQELTTVKQPVRLYVEYLDTGRFPEAAQQEALYNFLKAKYSSTHLDLIIAESDPAVTFFRKHQKLFPGVQQILFQTDCQPGGSLTSLDKNDWTVKIVTDLDSSVSEMLRLVTPNKLFIIADTTDSNGANRLSSFKETQQPKH